MATSFKRSHVGTDALSDPNAEKARVPKKKIYFRFIDYAKVFDCVDHNKLWKILKEMGIPEHLTCLLRNLYAAQEATSKKKRKKEKRSNG